MKKLFYIFVVALMTMFVSCDKNENIVNDHSTPTNPEELYAKTEYNLDMCDLAKAINLAVNQNKSFRKLIKDEAQKEFDGDYDILLSDFADKSVAHNDVDNGIAIPNKVKANLCVKDLLEDAYYTLNIENRLKSARAKSSIQRINSAQKIVGASIVDVLTQQYPLLQVSVPVHVEDLEDESYFLPVTFIPEEFDEKSTEYLPLISKDGVTQIDVTEEPENAVIVIGMNERSIILNFSGPITTPPTSLTAQNSESGIYLNWGMTSGTTSNVMGYRIYRTIANQSSNSTVPILIGTVSGNLNRQYVDVNVLNNITYRYYVTAFNLDGESEPSNYITISVDRANAATSFSAAQESLNLVKLTWAFGGDQYNGNVKIYKREIGVSSNYGLPITSLLMPADEYFDTNIQYGKKIEYKLVRETSTGVSNPKYDVVFYPYRDISKQSSVYIDKVKYSDISKIESWVRGKPEFKVKVLGVSGTTTVEISEMWFRMDTRTDNAWSTISSTYGTVTKNWKPDYGRWFDCYSFYFVEDDGGLKWRDITIDAKGFEKLKLDSTSVSNAEGVLKTINTLGKTFSTWLESADEKIGYTYLNYYDDPSMECSTGSAPNGGYLTVKYKDHE